MYELKTYEALMEEKISRIKEEFGLGVNEGGLLFNAIAPNSWELASAYAELDYLLDCLSGETADRDMLIKKALEVGMSAPNDATYAIFKAEFNCPITTGVRFSLDIYNYFILEQIEGSVFKVQCETAGKSPNNILGELTPIDYTPGFERGTIIELVLPGEDEEETDHYRQRYYDFVQLPSTSGNKYDYYNWASEVTGVGAVSVHPLENGPGTVKIVIANTENRAATDSLVKNVSEYIEERRPIGADVEVVSVTEKVVNITANVLLNGISNDEANTKVKSIVSDYLQKNAFEINYISIARIGNLILDVPGVEDYSELLLNEKTANVIINVGEVAVVGAVALKEVGAVNE